MWLELLEPTVAVVKLCEKYVEKDIRGNLYLTKHVSSSIFRRVSRQKASFFSRFVGLKWYVQLVSRGHDIIGRVDSAVRAEEMRRLIWAVINTYGIIAFRIKERRFQGKLFKPQEDPLQNKAISSLQLAKSKSWKRRAHRTGNKRQPNTMDMQIIRYRASCLAKT